LHYTYWRKKKMSICICFLLGLTKRKEKANRRLLSMYICRLTFYIMKCMCGCRKEREEESTRYDIDLRGWKSSHFLHHHCRHPSKPNPFYI
jgi:hypothetical protein